MAGKGKVFLRILLLIADVVVKSIEKVEAIFLTPPVWGNSDPLLHRISLLTPRKAVAPPEFVSVVAPALTTIGRPQHRGASSSSRLSLSSMVNHFSVHRLSNHETFLFQRNEE